MVDFHSEATFILIFDGIRETVHNATLLGAVQKHINYCSNGVFTIQM
jgi:hypothetical protein